MTASTQALKAHADALLAAGELVPEQANAITAVLRDANVANSREDRLITIEEFSARCSASRATVFRMIKRGKIKRVLLSARSARIPESELDRLIAGE
jgi:excisionase family DNA binding protein